MLFDAGPEVFESEKERNLYYKLFAGVLFNELVPGYEARVSRFCELLNGIEHRGRAADEIPIALDPSTTHVSFDNHLYRFAGIDSDRGEFADVFIQDRTSRTLVAIEAKVHTDWTYEKDISGNGARLKAIEAQIGPTTVVPCLLVTRGKWEGAVRMRNAGKSQFKLFTEDPENRYRVLFWEDVAALCDSPLVDAFVAQALEDKRGKGAYKFVDDWFSRARG